MAERSYNGRELLTNYNADFENSPGGVATTVSNRWIDGTAGGSVADSTYKWGINNVNSIGSYESVFDGTVSHSGGSSLRVSTKGVGAIACSALNVNNTLPNVGFLPTQPQKTYRYSYWMKTNLVSGSSTGAYFQFTIRNSSGSALASHSGTQVATTTDWTQYTGSFTTPNKATYLTALAFVVGNGGAGTLIMDAWFDDISLTEVLPARTPATSRTTATNRVAVRDMGTALSFDGVDDYVEVPDADIPASVFTSGFTLSAWIKPMSRGEGSYARIMVKGTGSSDGFQYNIDDTNAISFRSNAGTTKYTANNILRFRQWMFVTVTVSSAGLVTHYINSVVSGTPGTSGLPSGIATTNNFTIGNISGGTTATFRGKIDEPRIWNRALTAQEISDLYYNNVVPQDGLVAEYLFDEASGTTALDTSGNGNDGTITGATYTTDVPLTLRDSI